MTTGRGAWTRAGGTTPFYELTEPPLGSAIAKDDGLDPNGYAERAVYLAVIAIQGRVKVTPDGWFGPLTKRAVEATQRSLGLTDDGVVGPRTTKALWRPLIIQLEDQAGIPGHHLGGIGVKESLFDPGAVGYSTPDDKGIFQYNLDAHPGVTLRQAFDPTWAARATAERLAAARRRYVGKGQELKNACSIAQHNSPRWADEWFKQSSPPNDTIAKYVADVLTFGENFT